MEKDANGNGIVRRTAYRNASTKIREIIKAIRETADRQARTKPECAVRRTKSAANGTKQSAVLRRRHSDRDTTTTNKRYRLFKQSFPSLKRIILIIEASKKTEFMFWLYSLRRAQHVVANHRTIHSRCGRSPM